MTGQTRDDSSALRLFVIAATAATLLFAFITPPFKVPDEVGHFWRAASIAQGAVVPHVGAHGAVARLPVGLKTIVYIFYREPAPSEPQRAFRREQFRLLRELPLEPGHLEAVTFPAGYSPAVYAPQVAAAFLGRITGAKPAITFYLGRLFNAAAYIALLALAIAVTPVLRWFFCAAGLFPMALFLAASWSADAMTIGAAFLLTALLLCACHGKGSLSGGDAAGLSGAGLLVGLCKPAYFLIALLALAIPAARARRRALVIASILFATLAGVALSMWTARRGGGAPRPDVRLDARAQVECIRAKPLHFAGVIVHDFRSRGSEYVEQCVGRLGMVEIRLPRPVVWAELMALLIAAMCSGSAVSWRARTMAAVAFLGTLFGVALSLYIGWTPTCAEVIDGIQGRYFLPVVPLVGIVIAAPLLRDRRLPLTVNAIVASAAIGTSIYEIVVRYYS